MEKTELFRDWLFRYRYVYRSRSTNKSKQRFLKAIVTDILPFRKDIQVVEYDHTKKTAARNLYVGDLNKAKRIICTYYDTPPQHFGDYRLFDRREQKRKTSQFILSSSLVMILLGLFGTWIYIHFVSESFSLISWQTIIFALIIGFYFLLLNKVSRGEGFQRNLTRNTSSVLALLSLIVDTNQASTAFAFLDEGAYGERGLAVMRDSAGPNAQIYYLDSIGADAQIQAVGQHFNEAQLEHLEINYHSEDSCSINYLFSAEEAQSQVYVLSKKQLKQNELNMSNMQKVFALFS
ncbi:hypothetical protein [Enterococcus sp. RIT-PI-f]|uniref:hypothetical protein n=1 Tax=Enterococcus sp. RIT-PI-f TaxID=1690244 RepID=UPI0006B8A6E9|nr:hypothetical protein [Enterococcus sp. RIT-PI-f]KPG73863.1 hypothetical protein AEQ18_01010 [Enterococcus sp. RIT-PI-f]